LKNSLRPLIAGLSILIGAAPALCAKELEYSEPRIWLVEIDNKSVEKYGKFPWSRDKYADLIRKVSTGSPKLIIIKLFLDQLKNPDQDRQLARAIQKSGNVILQARLSREKEAPTRLNKKFGLKHPIKHYSGTYSISMPSSDHGWIPAPIFQEHALDVGFVDILSTDNLKGIPLVVYYKGAISDTQGWTFPSLPLAIYRQFYGIKDFRLRHDPKALTVEFGGHTTSVGEQQELPVDWKYLHKIHVQSVADVLQADFDSKIFSDVIVIIGYGGPEMPRSKLSNGQVVDGNRIIAAAALHLLSEFRPNEKH